MDGAGNMFETKVMGQGTKGVILTISLNLRFIEV